MRNWSPARAPSRLLSCLARHVRVSTGTICALYRTKPGSRILYIDTCMTGMTSGVPCSPLWTVWLTAPHVFFHPYLIHRHWWTAGAWTPSACDFVAKNPDIAVIGRPSAMPAAALIAPTPLPDRNAYADTRLLFSAATLELKEAMRAVKTSEDLARLSAHLQSFNATPRISDPPVVQTKGRPRSTRLKGSGEGKAPRKRALITCRSCGKQEGHNSATCPLRKVPKHVREAEAIEPLVASPARPITEAAAMPQRKKRARQSVEDRAPSHTAAGVAWASPMTSAVYISPRPRKRQSERLDALNVQYAWLLR